MAINYPEAPGYKTLRPETSAQSAEIIQAISKTLKDRCLSTLKGAYMTADEVAETLGKSVLSIRPRIAELHATGDVVDTGMRRENNSGHKAVVWRAKEKYEQAELI